MAHYSDRSRYEAGNICQRSRYWGYHFEGRGIVATERNNPDLAFGSLIHADVESAFSGKSIPIELVDSFYSLVQTGSDEWASLRHGMNQTFRKWTLPDLLGEYEWLGSEIEATMSLPRDPIQWMSRFDAVLRRRRDGLYFCLEIKTTGWPEKLMTETSTNFQLLMEIEAMRQHFSLSPNQIGGALLLVFNKGTKVKIQKDKEIIGYWRKSPFCYWWEGTKTGDAPQYRLEWTKGWNRVPVWTIPDWFEMGGQDTFREQVQLCPSVSFSPELAESVLDQVTYRERDLAAADQRKVAVAYQRKMVDRLFPQNFKSCTNYGGFNRSCEFKSCCFNASIREDPIGSNLFDWRSYNHPQEEEK